MKSFFKILSHVKSYKGKAGLVVLFNVMYVLFNLASILLFIPFLSLLFKVGPTEAPIPPVGDMEFTTAYFKAAANYEMFAFIDDQGKLGALGWICLTILVCFFFKNLFRYMAMYHLAYIRTGVMRDVRNQIHRRIVSLDLGFFSDERKGDIQARALNDAQEIEVSIMGTLELLFREPLAIILTLIFLFFISWELTLFSLILLPVSALVISRIGRSLKRTSLKAQNKLGELSAALEETLSGIRIIKGFNAEDHTHERFSETNSSYRKVLTRAYRKRDLASPLNELLGAGVMIALVYFGGKIVLESDNVDGEWFLGFIIAFSQLLVPIQGLANSISNVNKGLASLERVNKILDASIDIKDKPNALPFSGLQSGIEYRDVGFNYNGADQPVLQDINLHIPKGQTVALVGESGGGKSTLADLLPRFFDCTSGGIYVDGQNLKDLKLADVRDHLGIVTQQSILFNDSIKSNIAFGTVASDDAIEQAARIANAHQFISQFPDGYEHNIGDAGAKLSGGQRQRLSIARAVLRNPDILILDEATSALDTESEKLVQEALEKLMTKRTSLVIAHRLSTIKHAHEIVVLQNGKIAERGNHDSLYAKNGVYRRLCDLQSFS